MSPSAKVERHRDIIGLDSSHLMRIVAKAADFAASPLSGAKRANAARVQEWLNQHVNWGTLCCPNKETVERHLTNWSAIQNSRRVLELIESAMQRWGRNNLLDWPTKIRIVVAKNGSRDSGLCH